MARGWESKAVESQIESAAERKREPNINNISAAEVVRQRERESLELSRTRVLQDMAACGNPKYKVLLQRSLNHLDEKLAAFDSDSRTKSQSA